MHSVLLSLSKLNTDSPFKLKETLASTCKGKIVTLHTLAIHVPFGYDFENTCNKRFQGLNFNCRCKSFTYHDAILIADVYMLIYYHMPDVFS